MRAFFTITHPFYPLPILYNSRDVPRNNNFSPFPRPSKTLISRNETSIFFRPLHLSFPPPPLSVKTADKMASRDVPFVSSLSPSLRLQNLFTSSFGLLAPFTSTAKQVPSPILSPFERLVPPIKPRELLFSRPVSTAHCSLAQVSLRFKHFFFTLYPPPPRDFLYIKARRHSRRIPVLRIVRKDIAFSNESRITFSFLFFSPQEYSKIFSKIFPSSKDGLFLFRAFAASNFERVSPVDGAVEQRLGLNQVDVVRR